MPNSFPCPNPTCDQVLSPDALRGATAVTCPRCGTVFQFRVTNAPSQGPSRSVAPPPPRSAPPPPPPPPPPGRVPPPPPIAHPVAPLLANPFPTVAADEQTESFAKGSRIRATRSRPPKMGMGMKIVAVSVVVLLALAGAGAMYFAWEFIAPDNPGRRRLPPGWSADRELAKRFKVRASCASRKKPRVHFAYVIRDYTTRDATKAEILTEALLIINQAVKERQYEDPYRAGVSQTETLDGRPAIIFPFDGIDNGVMVHGECTMLAYHGRAYWLLCWGPKDQEDEVAEEIAKVRKWATIHHDREGWIPIPRRTVPVDLEGVPVRIAFVEEIWRRGSITPEKDAPAELVSKQLYLQGFDLVSDDMNPTRKKRATTAGYMAEAHVLLFPQAATVEDASNVVLKYLRDTQPKLNESASIEVIKGEPVGNKLGTYEGKIVRLRVKPGGDYEKFGMLGVANVEQGTLAVYGESRWDTRSIWAEEFTDLMATVVPARKKK